MPLTASHFSLADLAAPHGGAARRARQALLVVFGIAALAVAAKINVPVWPSPVPVTLGTFAVLTIGAAYGARLGLATILGYMLVGALGYDVFAGSSAEKAGLEYMMGGTGGYLAGYVLATLTLGALAERGWDRSVLWMALAMVIGNAMIYVPGLNTNKGPVHRTGPFLVGGPAISIVGAWSSAGMHSPAQGVLERPRQPRDC